MSAASTLVTRAMRAMRAVQDRIRERYRLRGEIARMDSTKNPTEIAHALATKEFPWGINQALSFALFRTYAVPSIGDLLYKTGGFTKETQKRYDDTVLLLEAPLEYGIDSPLGRAGIRRINQMHGMYDISNDDFLYVLSTFVVCPVEWVEAYEWRPLTDHEVRGMTNYYRRLGQLMGIKGIPRHTRSSSSSTRTTRRPTSPSAPTPWPSPTPRSTCWAPSGPTRFCRARWCAGCRSRSWTIGS